MTYAAHRIFRWSSLLPAVTLWLGACATPPKPPALLAYESLEHDPNIEETRKRFPDLVASAEQFGEKADKNWQSNDLDDSSRAALMAEIKLKTALARNEQERAKARISVLTTDQARADEALASVNKDLAGMNEQVKLIQQAEDDKRRLTQQIVAEQDERQKLSQQLATEQKLVAAQLAMRTAETVDAHQYAPAEYGAAANMMAKADAEVKQGAWGMAQASLEVARAKAEKAIEIAKPIYEKEAQAAQNMVRDEALARDAAGVPGVAVRLERRGELQRLIIAVQDLFARSQTTLQPGKDDALDPIARLIMKYPTYPVQVVGHTDNRGKAGELIALSQARAQSVFSSLVAKGVEARRMMVSGQGPNEPIADNKIPAGRAKNARIEVIFLYH
jgi:outer membrane protein OmpA-like peptidoglycan-associated protein